LFFGGGWVNHTVVVRKSPLRGVQLLSLVPRGRPGLPSKKGSGNTLSYSGGQGLKESLEGEEGGTGGSQRAEIHYLTVARDSGGGGRRGRDAGSRTPIGLGR